MIQRILTSSCPLPLVRHAGLQVFANVHNKCRSVVHLGICQVPMLLEAGDLYHLEIHVTLFFGSLRWPRTMFPGQTRV